MKTMITKIVLLAAIFLSGLGIKAQCAANFIFSQNANGNVTFTSTSILSNTATTVYYWTYSNAGPTFTGTGLAGMFPSYTYSANGTYVVTLFILSSAPSCSSSTQQTITISSVSSTCNLVANFSASQGTNGLVNFNNTSTGTVAGTTYTWNFGNGNTSNALSPSHTYTSNGNYVVTLSASNNTTPACVNTKTMLVNVNTICNVNAGFTFSYGNNGQVSFLNTTTPSVGMTYTWNFGNSAGSTVANPLFTYPVNGTYTVTLHAVQNSFFCNSTFTAVVTVTNVTGCNLTANFSATQGTAGVVNFNNLSTGTVAGTSYTWNFGNGNTSNAVSPSNTYSANGIYTVTLNASNNSTPSCTSTKTLTIHVISICNLNASFTYTVGNNGQVNFNNTSSGTLSPPLGMTSYTWSFGNSSSSNSVNPTKTYLNGTYTVILTARNNSVFPTCISTASQVITVTTNTCVANANFTLQPTNTPKFWHAIPSATAGVTAAQWNWGDGNVSNTLFTSHQYSVSGTYTICLSVTVSCGATASFCSSYFIFKGSGSNEMINIDVIEPGAVGINELKNENTALSVFPNPAKDAINISLNRIVEEGSVKISIYNLTGQVVYESDVASGNGKVEKQLPVQNLASGIYIVRVQSGKSVYSGKVSILK